MKHFQIIFITFTTFVPKSQTIGESQVSDSSTDIVESKETRNLTHPSKAGYNYPSGKCLNDYDDVTYESWYKPHREFYLTPVRIIKRIGTVPEIITRVVEVKRRPTSQYFYKIFIKDSPGLRFNHIIQTGGPKSSEGNFSNALHIFDRTAMKREDNKTSVFETVFHTGSLSGVPQRNVSDKGYESSNKRKDVIRGQSIIERLKNEDETTLNGTRHTTTTPQEPGLGILTGQSTFISEVDVSNTPEIDGETTEKFTGIIKYGPLRGTTLKGNDVKTDRFESNADATLRNKPNNIQDKIEIMKPPSQFFTEPYEIPSSMYAHIPGSKAIQSNGSYNISETLYSPRNNHVISRTENENPQNKTTHIMKLNPLMGFLNSSESIHPRREGVQTYSPGQISPPAIDFQKSTVFDPKARGMNHYFYNHSFNKRTSPIPDRKGIPQHFYGNLASAIPDNRNVQNREPLPTMGTPDIPANFHDPRKIYTLEDMLRWRKAHAYPVYGKHSSREIMRRKIMSDLKSGTVQKYKTSRRQ